MSFLYKDMETLRRFNPRRDFTFFVWLPKRANESNLIFWISDRCICPQVQV